MRKRHIIPLVVIFSTVLGLFLATRYIYTDDKNEVSEFVKIDSRLQCASLVSGTLSDDVEPVVTPAAFERVMNSQPYAGGSIKVSRDTGALNWISDTMLLTEVIASQNPAAADDLTSLKFDYVASTSDGPLILAQNGSVGIYLIRKPACNEMLLMNYFERAVQVDVQEEAHLGMPNIITTNYDMTTSFYVWNGSSYVLDHEGRWNCPA